MTEAGRADACGSRPPSPRYESLTLWRGVACLFVVLYHTIFTGWGLQFPDGKGAIAVCFPILQRLWIGVPLFFVISGYCVTAAADVLRREPGGGRRFFWRRFRRIYPPYWIWFAVAAGWVAGMHLWVLPDFFQSAFVPNPAGLNGWQWVGNLTLTETWRWHLTGGMTTTFLSHSWTLCYEEQFYAIMGLTLLLARRRFFVALAGVTVCIAVAVILLPWLGIRVEGLFLDGSWLMFAAGVLVYYATNYASPRSRRWWACPLAVGVLYALADPQQLRRPWVGEPNHSYLAAFSFALLILALHRWDHQLTIKRALWPLRYCGEMCYSLYLVHLPTVLAVTWGFNWLGFRNPLVILCGGTFCSVLLAVVLARIFHLHVERRFLNPNTIAQISLSAEESQGVRHPGL